mgnify:CR=1 FL=1
MSSRENTAQSERVRRHIHGINVSHSICLNRQVQHLTINVFYRFKARLEASGIRRCIVALRRQEKNVEAQTGAYIAPEPECYIEGLIQEVIA